MKLTTYTDVALNTERATCLSRCPALASSNPAGLYCTDDLQSLISLSKFISSILDRFSDYDKTIRLTELEVRKTHTTRAGRISQRPKFLMENYFV